MPSTRYVLLRAGKGFVPGLVVGALWALWAVRRRRVVSEQPAVAQQPSADRQDGPVLRPAG